MNTATRLRNAAQAYRDAAVTPRVTGRAGTALEMSLAEEAAGAILAAIGTGHLPDQEPIGRWRGGEDVPGIPPTMTRCDMNVVELAVGPVGWEMTVGGNPQSGRPVVIGKYAYGTGAKPIELDAITERMTGAEDADGFREAARRTWWRRVAEVLEQMAEQVEDGSGRDIMSVDMAAKILKRSPQTIREYRRLGWLKNRGTSLVSAADVERLRVNGIPERGRHR